MHYQTSFEKYKHDTKQTWCIIKKIIKKNSKSDQFPNSFKIHLHKRSLNVKKFFF